MTREEYVKRDIILLRAILAVDNLENHTSENFQELAVEHSKIIREVEELFSIKLISRSYLSNPSTIKQGLRNERYKLAQQIKKEKIKLTLPFELDILKLNIKEWIHQYN